MNTQHLMRTLDADWVQRENDLIGKTFRNSSNLEFIVTNYYYNQKKNYKLMKVKFVLSGYEAIVNRNAINKGLIVDRLSPTVAGVGILGFATMKDNKQIYYIWSGLLNRCYNQNDKGYCRYGLKGVSVCERWKRFDYFLEDFQHIDGYDEAKFLNGDLALDKDIKQLDLPHEKRVYSPDTCTLVSKSVNSKHAASTHEGKNIVAINNETGLEVYCKSISMFAKKFNLNRHSISKYCDTGIEYKGWMIKKRGAVNE